MFYIITEIFDEIIRSHAMPSELLGSETGLCRSGFLSLYGLIYGLFSVVEPNLKVLK